jgi:hypothetical protein
LNKNKIKINKFIGNNNELSEKLKIKTDQIENKSKKINKLKSKNKDLQNKNKSYIEELNILNINLNISKQKSKE